MTQAAARYREFEPCPELAGTVRCFFTFEAPAGLDEPGRAMRRERLFGPAERFTAPLFADCGISMAFVFGAGYYVDGLWRGTGGHVIGPMSGARPAAHGERIVQAGVYFRAARARRLFGVPGTEMADRILPLNELWGGTAISLEERMEAARSDAERVNLLEEELLERMPRRTGNSRAEEVAALAEYVKRRRGMVTVAELADSAGISRQQLGRMFREETGLAPKLFCRLARFRAVLAGSGRESGAGLAAAFGFVDQSHMIAEFREFSGLTPKQALGRERIHPFTSEGAFLSP